MTQKKQQTKKNGFQFEKWNNEKHPNVKELSCIFFINHFK